MNQRSFHLRSPRRAREHAPRRTRRHGLCAVLIAIVVAALSPIQVMAQPSPASTVPAPPQVDARSYILLDYHTGKVLAEKDPDLPLDPASLTKLMTTYVVFGEIEAGRLSLDDEVLVSERAWRMGGSKMFIEVGKRIRVEDLLRGVIVQSGNDASLALAEHIADSEENFARMMEQQAQLIGLERSHFRNATGMPADNHVVSARDVATLSRRLIADFPRYYSLYSEPEFTFNDIPQKNRNPLLDTFDGADGLKTGHTDAAGYCLAASAERDGMRLISVVMGASSPRARALASRSLLNYGFRFYATHRLYGAQQAVTSLRVWKGAAEEVSLGLADELVLTIPRGSYERLEASTSLMPDVIAPVQASQELGRLIVTLDGTGVVDLPLIALDPVPPGSFTKRALDQVKMWLN